MDYHNFITVKEALPQKMAWFFRPEVFLQLLNPEEGVISTQMLFGFITRSAALVEALFTLTNYSREYDGYLTEDELQNYIEDMMPHLNLKLQSINLKRFYICT